MKNALIVILLLAVLLLGWYGLRNLRMTFSGEKGELQKVTRGDLTIPINATGEVRYKRLVEIKSEASGKVDRRLVEAGDEVKKNELIVELSPEEEGRSVRRATAERDRAEASLKQAEITLRERRHVGVAKAQAALDEAKAQVEKTEADWKHAQDVYPKGAMPETEYRTYKANYDLQLARKAAAEANLQDAHIAIELAERDVDLAEAAFKTADNNLEDAKKRLRDTEVLSPIDGMVTQTLVQVGEVIQAGKGTFTGGTVLAVVADTSDVYVRAEVDEADFGEIWKIAPPSARFGGNVETGEPDPMSTSPSDESEATTAPVPQRLPGTAAGPETSTVTVLVEAYRDEKFEGVIKRIYPEPRKAASVVTYYVDILLTGTNRGRLAMGMQADVEFTAQSVRRALLVRHDAIFKEDNDLGVYVPVRVEGKPDPEPKFIKCRFGLDNGLSAEVLEGDIKEGDSVYTKLPQKIEEEEKK